jgi:hypothetical protein
MTFKVGDRVRCVKGYRAPFPPHAEVVKDQFYLIEEVAHTVRVHGVDSYWCVERFELAKAATPHKWVKEIKAWADGAEIEWRFETHNGWSPWQVMVSPAWATASTQEYRIKPEKKPDVVLYGMYNSGSVLEVGPPEAKNTTRVCLTSFRDPCDSVQFTFDGETGKLKAVQLLSVS